MAKKILVTGGLGYIGSHTVVSLQEQGFVVYIADDLSNSRLSVLDQIASITGVRPGFTQMNLCDVSATKELFLREKFDGVIHFAAHKAVGESVQNPLKYYTNNLGALESVLYAMEASGTENIIFSSSCTVYGEADEFPIKETTPLKIPVSPYGKTKLFGEQIISDFCDATLVRGISLRYFNPIGAHSSARIGELPLGHPDNLVPYITQTAIGIREELSIFGNDYDTPDGTCIRDYIHVCDLSEAHVAALRRILSNTKTNFEVFNVGTGKGHSVLQMVLAFEEATGIKLNYKIAARRPGDATAYYANTDKVHKELGWKASRDLNEMLKSAWDWQLTLEKND